MELTIFGNKIVVPPDLSRFSYSTTPIHGCRITFYDTPIHNLVSVRNVDDQREIMIHSRGLPYLQWEIQLAVREIRGQDPKPIAWNDWYFITHILFHSHIPYTLYGKSVPTGCGILGMDFHQKWSKDESCWQYEYHEFSQRFSSEVFAASVKPSSAHWRTWIERTIYTPD
jgi:hypothetical protein